MAFLISTPVSGQGIAVGEFDGHGDVGDSAIPGTATYNAVSRDYHLSAGGTNMWEERDEFQFVWKRMTGDFILQARIEFLGEGVDPHRKAGLMIRSSMDDDSPYADAMIDGRRAPSPSRSNRRPSDRTWSASSGRATATSCR
jgi:hypothetical protein